MTAASKTRARDSACITTVQLDVIGKRADEVLRDYAAAAQWIEAEPLTQPVCRDPDDDAVLALAWAAQADLIISGDQDLLALRQFERTHRCAP